MCWWDKEFIKRMEEAGVDVIMYKRFVDDINLVLRNSGCQSDEVNVPAERHDLHTRSSQ